MCEQVWHTCLLGSRGLIQVLAVGQIDQKLRDASRTQRCKRVLLFHLLSAGFVVLFLDGGQDSL